MGCCTSKTREPSERSPGEFSALPPQPPLYGVGASVSPLMSQPRGSAAWSAGAPPMLPGTSQLSNFPRVTPLSSHGSPPGSTRSASSGSASLGDVHSAARPAANGNPLGFRLPTKGTWKMSDHDPTLFYCAAERLFYHPPSRQYYCPITAHWYDPAKDEWYLLPRQPQSDP
jgi:hypothetical protein